MWGGMWLLGTLFGGVESKVGTHVTCKSHSRGAICFGGPFLCLASMHCIVVLHPCCLWRLHLWARHLSAHATSVGTGDALLPWLASYHCIRPVPLSTLPAPCIFGLCV